MVGHRSRVNVAQRYAYIGPISKQAQLPVSEQRSCKLRIDKLGPPVVLGRWRWSLSAAPILQQHRGDGKETAHNPWKGGL